MAAAHRRSSDFCEEKIKPATEERRQCRADGCSLCSEASGLLLPCRAFSLPGSASPLKPPPAVPRGTPGQESPGTCSLTVFPVNPKSDAPVGRREPGSSELPEAVSAHLPLGAVRAGRPPASAPQIPCGEDSPVITPQHGWQFLFFSPVFSSSGCQPGLLSLQWSG